MKVGKVGVILGEKKDDNVHVEQGGSFKLTYDPEDKTLNTMAIVRINGKTISVDRARWDTGANVSLLSLVKAPVSPSHEELEITGMFGEETASVYRAEVEFPGGIRLSNVKIHKMYFGELDAEMIIGMDVISQGTFMVGKEDGRNVFSFSI